STPDARTCWAKMLTLGNRSSCQVMIAPPAPSVAAAECSWAAGAVAMARPQGGHSAAARRGTAKARSSTAPSETPNRTRSDPTRIARLLSFGNGCRGPPPLAGSAAGPAARPQAVQPRARADGDARGGDRLAVDE